MSAVRIYTNESVHVAVADGLKQRGVDAWSARDAGTRGLSDDAQLEYARREHAVIVTHDEDFSRAAGLVAQAIEQDRGSRVSL